MMLLSRGWLWLVAFALSEAVSFKASSRLKPSIDHGYGRDIQNAAFKAPSRPQSWTRPAAGPDPRLLDEVLDALRVLQDDYFEPWQGTWPTSIDWTAAVIGTHVSGALSSLSYASSIKGVSSVDDRERENLIALYFSQTLGFYFGENAVAVRGEAFDDMLWVVLGWLETVKFVDLHTQLYYPSGEPRTIPGQQQPVDEATGKAYFGNAWIPAFAHRARVFWELAAKGWDTKWCGGGMNWNPNLQVYKNAITNELFVAGSISMYLYFPGDDNQSPFSLPGGRRGTYPPHDAKYLDAAVAGYIWLRDSGMRNGPGQEPEGLYVDGFHISGWGDPSSNNTACDSRNPMVYTYNQGVILTGLRGLWSVKGNESYIRDGHDLIRSTIRATGYDLSRDRPLDDLDRLQPGQLPPWRGLGRAGVLEDQCDVSGSCSQDSQTFKGILFHHLVAFCATAEGPGVSASLSRFHAESCASYRGWVAHNARAARATRDDKGHFGMWWTAGLLDISALDLSKTAGDGFQGTPKKSVDYRTYGVPNTAEWVPSGAPNSSSSSPGSASAARNGAGKEVEESRESKSPSAVSARRGTKDSDPNSRGRGRTVETQAGGLAVLRAAWEFSNIRR